MKIQRPNSYNQNSRRAGQPQLNLRLSGFSKQGIVSVDEIIEALKRVPEIHLAGLREIAYDPNRLVQRAISYYSTPNDDCLTPDFNSRGDYLHDEQWVNIYKFHTKTEFHHLLYHEIGHYVFHNILTARQRRTWVVSLYPGSFYITPYAATNANEDFAECYATYNLKPNKLKSLRRKFAFLETLFKNK